ncbi:PD-(D/E)XK nuclease family protein [Sphingobacterium sp. xlx-130]|uniref:PDDEXK-like family protein n=1 Tax=Sphingobacterium sp. xlx-130 TaxID=2654323 RepID=UPI0013D995F1|nr:PD-(D/E)XK nuclease family protein [Sphingobacterium sp. xlx-130]
MNDLKSYFEQQLIKQTKEYNIFSVLHREDDETRLHSRFLAFLLDPKESHNVGDMFFKLFLEQVLNIEFDYTNYEVRKEFEYIDILIHNDSDAIIVENKIYAGDSNHNEDEEDLVKQSILKKGYKGQLERYYNTVATGINKNDKETGLKLNVIQVAYLTLAGHSPTDKSTGMLPMKPKKISYIDDISKWLEQCAAMIGSTSPKLSADIRQYRQLVIKLTSEVPQVLKNKAIISDKIDIAWQLENSDKFFTRDMAPIFNHVKWHTIDDFFNELAYALEQLENCNVGYRPDPESITKVAHSKGKSTHMLILSFVLNGNSMQIVSDSKGLTLGNMSTSQWDNIKGVDVKLNEFSKENTFLMIDIEHREKVISEIVSFTLENYNKLKKDFKPVIDKRC